MTDHFKQLDQLVCEIAAKFEAGESLELAAFEREHPALADRLRRLWPTFSSDGATGTFSRECTKLVLKRDGAVAHWVTSRLFVKLGAAAWGGRL